MSLLSTLLALAATPSVVDYASNVQVRREATPAQYVTFPSAEVRADYKSPVLHSWIQRLNAGDDAAWKASFAAANALLSTGGAEAVRTGWNPLTRAQVLCGKLASAPEALRPVLHAQYCLVLDDDLKTLPLDDVKTSLAWLETRLPDDAKLAKLGAPAIAAVLVKAAQQRHLFYGPRFQAQESLSPTWAAATKLAIEQAKEATLQFAIAEYVPRRQPEAMKWLASFCAKTATDDTQRKACAPMSKPPVTFAGPKTFLESYDALADAKRMAAEGTSTADLLLAAEACVRNEARDFPSDARIGCLSLLAELDFGRAKRLIEDPTLWFLSSTQHFELVAAVVMGQPPVDALRSVGLLPADFTPAPFSSHYPRDLLRAAGRADLVGAERGEGTKALSLGKTPLAGAVLDYDAKTGAASLWFKGQRYSAKLKPGAAGANLAAFLNAVAKKEKLEQRWLCLGEGFYSELVVGTEAQLAAGREKKLLLRAKDVGLE